MIMIINNFDNLNKFLTLENMYIYPYNLNFKLKDNIIETKKEIELEYIKSYKNTFIYKEKNKNNKQGGKKQIIIIY